jgi:dTDP-4-dehydrorhamnose 3,5-epimerase
MQFTSTAIEGVWIIDCDIFKDNRGFFAVGWIPDEFSAHGLDTSIAQISIAFNHTRGTIRGLHFQVPPFQEAKVVRVVRGAVFDVAVDLRRDSRTFRQWVGVELSADNRRMMYVPKGLAHGYQTLTDDAEVFYLVSAKYSPSHQGGVRWSDPAFGIEWPLGKPTTINERDATYPDFA